MIIAALVALLSLDMTNKLVTAGRVATTYNIVDASNTSPIVVATDVPHNIPPGQTVHAIVSDIGGNDDANGAWILSYVDETHLALSTYTAYGATQLSVGSGTYTSGGIAQVGFPAGRILLGRRAIGMQNMLAPPRIVFVPLGTAAWQLSPYGGHVVNPTTRNYQGEYTGEQKRMLLRRQINTEVLRFEIEITGAANPPDPEGGDFAVTQALYHELYQTMFDMIGPDRARVLKTDWLSQKDGQPSIDTRGQVWSGIVEIEIPVQDSSLEFVPANVAGEITVNLIGGASSDATIIEIPQVETTP